MRFHCYDEKVRRGDKSRKIVRSRGGRAEIFCRRLCLGGMNIIKKQVFPLAVSRLGYAFTYSITHITDTANSYSFKHVLHTLSFYAKRA